MRKHSKILNSELDRLKELFNKGHELKLLYFPGAKRTGQFGNPISGEVQKDHILIYDPDEETRKKRCSMNLLSTCSPP